MMDTNNSTCTRNVKQKSKEEARFSPHFAHTKNVFHTRPFAPFWWNQMFFWAPGKPLALSCSWFVTSEKGSCVATVGPAMLAKAQNFEDSDNKIALVD